MRLAVLSDVHGNVPALEAVLEELAGWSPDRVVVNGDLVSRGPCSRAVLELLDTACPDAVCLHGNHEEYLLRVSDTPPDPGSPTYDIDRFALWCAAELGEARERLRDWRGHLDLEDLEGGASVHITHGSRLGNRDGISAHTPDDDLPGKLGAPCDLFIGAHTHKPLHRHFNGTLVVNTGSVGQPMDGDVRAAYGRFTLRDGRWQAEIRRVSYDRQRALRDFEDSGFVEGGGPLAAVIRRELEEARPHLGPWRRQWLEAVRRGEISVADSLRCYFATL